MGGGEKKFRADLHFFMMVFAWLRGPVQHRKNPNSHFVIQQSVFKFTKIRQKSLVLKFAGHHHFL